MEAIAPSGNAIAVLRAISQAGFRYERTKELAEAAKWWLVDDELHLGYVAFNMRPAPGKAILRRLTVEVSESGRLPRAFVPLFYFEGYDVQREPFDLVYRLLSKQLASVLGVPS